MLSQVAESEGNYRSGGNYAFMIANMVCTLEKSEYGYPKNKASGYQCNTNQLDSGKPVKVY